MYAGVHFAYLNLQEISSAVHGNLIPNVSLRRDYRSRIARLQANSPRAQAYTGNNICGVRREQSVPGNTKEVNDSHQEQDSEEERL